MGRKRGAAREGRPSRFYEGIVRFVVRHRSVHRKGAKNRKRPSPQRREGRKDSRAPLAILASSR